MSDEQLAELGRIALEKTTNMDRRWLALDTLTLARARAARALSEVAVARLPPEPPGSSRGEVIIRLAAVESLDQLAAEGVEVGESFRQLLASPDPTLRTAALIALRGFAQNRPGKFNRYFDSTVAKVGTR